MRGSSRWPRAPAPIGSRCSRSGMAMRGPTGTAAPRRRSSWHERKAISGSSGSTRPSCARRRHRRPGSDLRSRTMLLVYAGRRVDAAAAAGAKEAEERFPMRNLPRVAREIELVLVELKPSTVIGSAAFGADLLVLEAAGRLGVRRRVVFPFDRAAFRTISV